MTSILLPIRSSIVLLLLVPKRITWTGPVVLTIRRSRSKAGRLKERDEIRKKIAYLMDDFMHRLKVRILWLVSISIFIQSNIVVITCLNKRSPCLSSKRSSTYTIISVRSKQHAERLFSHRKPCSSSWMTLPWQWNAEQRERRPLPAGIVWDFPNL